MSVCNMPSTTLKDDFPPLQRKIVSVGDQETRLKQLHIQIEQLSLSNARLVRANRMLKLDCDRIIDEKTTELRQALKLAIEHNIRLQRSNRLLKDDYNIQSQQLNNYKRDQIRKMKNVGPEYEYLVQVINLLYRQLATASNGGSSNGELVNCSQTCCYTEEKSKLHHSCRPIVKSHIQSASMEARLEQENNNLRDGMDILINDRDALYQLLNDKEQDNETLKYELTVKDDIVKQLERDFEKMEMEVTDLQRDWSFNNSSSSSSSSRSPDSTFSSKLHSFPIVPPLIPNSDIT